MGGGSIIGGGDMKTPTEREWTQSDKNWSWVSQAPNIQMSERSGGIFARLNRLILDLPYQFVMGIVFLCLLTLGGLIGSALVFWLLWLYLNLRGVFTLVVGIFGATLLVLFVLKVLVRQSIESQRRLRDTWVRREMRRAYGTPDEEATQADTQKNYSELPTTSTDFDY